MPLEVATPYVYLHYDEDDFLLLQSVLCAVGYHHHRF